VYDFWLLILDVFDIRLLILYVYDFRPWLKSAPHYDQLSVGQPEYCIEGQGQIEEGWIQGLDGCRTYE